MKLHKEEIKNNLRRKVISTIFMAATLCILNVQIVYAKGAGDIAGNALDFISDQIGTIILICIVAAIAYEVAKRAWVPIMITIVVGGIIDYVAYHPTIIKTIGDTIGPKIFGQ